MINEEQRSVDDRRDDARNDEERRAAVTSNRVTTLDLENTTFNVGPDAKFEIKSMDTNQDGSVDIALDMDDTTKKNLCQKFGWDKVTEDKLQTLVISALDWFVKDGGDMASTVHDEQESAAE